MHVFGKNKPVHLLKKVLRLLRDTLYWGMSILRWLLCCTAKVESNKVAFMTFNFQYTCNPKYICQEILRQKLPVKIVWVVPKAQLKDPAIREKFPENATLVGFGTSAFVREVATAKVWVDNAFNFTWNPIPKKKSQLYIQNWHGSLGLKRIGADSVKDLHWTLSGRLNRRYVDLCISNSTFETGVYRQTHWPKTKILELGHARNDILFADEETTAAIKEKVLKHYGIDAGTKIALYAPTYRDGNTCDIDPLAYDRLLEALQTRFGGNWVLLNRYHFKIKHAPKAGDNPRVLSASDYPDMQELMVASDVGITDYSSWIYDFMLTNRPGFLYVPDLQEYDQTRGFYYPLSETPFPIAESNDELVQKVLSFDEPLYQSRHAQFLHDRGCKEQGTAAKQIVEIIKKHCGL